MQQDLNKPVTSRLIRLPDVIAKTGLGRSSVYAYERAGLFPKRVKLGRRAVAWEVALIDRWIAERPTVQNEAAVSIEPAFHNEAA